MNMMKKITYFILAHFFAFIKNKLRLFPKTKFFLKKIVMSSSLLTVFFRKLGLMLTPTGPALNFDQLNKALTPRQKVIFEKMEGNSMGTRK
ncbi:hypothetical protein C1N32_12955 [Vibrio diazotrophicus]|uniref:Uncharacterized protein n=1 Tax=Vibrio diazotrophicus TaxID=685 RepID=A0A2J8I1D7_VIBDI|nr:MULTISPECIES: hypothetical protein [Vibrio]MCF7363438.1 hypothetical protein [Vibrio sp. A1-b2]PNI04335.1 hypothetical protein C1N32_12955 [Vibrio diazotrophicus]